MTFDVELLTQRVAELMRGGMLFGEATLIARDEQRTTMRMRPVVIPPAVDAATDCPEPPRVVRVYAVKRRLSVLEMTAMRTGGVTLEAIASQAGVTRERIRQILSDTGASSLGATRVRDLGAAMRALREAKSFTDAARRCGESSGRLSRLAHALGMAEALTRLYRLRYRRRLLDALAGYARVIGKTPGKPDLDAAPRDSVPDCTALQRAFGSLRNAQFLAGLPYNKRGRPTETQAASMTHSVGGGA